MLNVVPQSVQSRWAFVAGVVAVTIGVLLHLPMYDMALDTGHHLAGMPIDRGMLAGMLLILAGVVLAGWGLMPPKRSMAAGSIEVVISETASLRASHWRLMAALTVALVIDVMKPASLGFVLSGTAAEYDLPLAAVALLPLSALTGTVIGSIIWGILADHYGRHATIMLSAVMFIGTSICGTMPSFAWNVAMCLLMGMAAGGMLPIAYALLAEMMPLRHRGWSMVLIGGLGTAGGYAAASAVSALLQPEFGWRVLWLANLPTGLILVALGPFLPESAKMLAAHGRREEAIAVAGRFGAEVRDVVKAPYEASREDRSPRSMGGALGVIVALGVTGLAWGWANFGVLLWLPRELVASGLDVGTASALLARSAIIAIPTTAVAAWLYHYCGPRKALCLSLVVMLAGIGLVLGVISGRRDPVGAIAVLLVGVNAVIAVLLPFTAESFALRIRGRATGIIAASTKAGGLVTQVVILTGAAFSLGPASLVLVPATLLAIFLVWRHAKPLHT